MRPSLQGAKTYKFCYKLKFTADLIYGNLPVRKQNEEFVSSNTCDTFDKSDPWISMEKMKCGVHDSTAVTHSALHVHFWS